MAGGNNKSFRADPQAFIRQHQLQVNVPGPFLIAGPADIDLFSIAPAVQLRRYDATQRHGWGARPVEAFFLPARVNDASTLVLNGARKYLFTHDLSGCLFAAYGPNAAAVTVEHVNELNAHAHVRIVDRALAIAQYPYHRILAPDSKAGALRQAGLLNQPGLKLSLYRIRSCVVGVRLGAEWLFYYKPSPNSVAKLGESL